MATVVNIVVGSLAWVEDDMAWIDEKVVHVSGEEIKIICTNEKILQALRRLKGISTGKKGKMSEHIKCTFYQLTEDSMKLMENGDYNVYHDEREVFEREAGSSFTFGRASIANFYWRASSTKILDLANNFGESDMAQQM